MDLAGGMYVKTEHFITATFFKSYVKNALQKYSQY